MDGCSPWRIYWRILLPLSTPVLATAAIFTFIWTWDDFFGPLIYLSDIRSYTVQLGLRTFVDFSAESDWGGLFAMSILTLVPVFVFFLFFQKLLIEGIATTGMKRECIVSPLPPSAPYAKQRRGGPTSSACARIIETPRNIGSRRLAPAGLAPSSGRRGRGTRHPMPRILPSRGHRPQSQSYLWPGELPGARGRRAGGVPLAGG